LLAQSGGSRSIPHRIPNALDSLNRERRRNPGWIPSASEGTADGTNAATNASAVSLPAGLVIYADLEGIGSGASAQSAIDYCTAWFTAVNDAHYAPGLYLSYDSMLSDAQLAALPFQHFWKSASTVPPIIGRGYQALQSSGIQEFGFAKALDNNVTQVDAQGGVTNWVSK
jgi:hypothetical protein